MTIIIDKFMLKVFHGDVPNVFDNFFTYNYKDLSHILKDEIIKMCSEA